MTTDIIVLIGILVLIIVLQIIIIVLKNKLTEEYKRYVEESQWKVG